MNEESIFSEAIAIESAEERGQFLDSACGDNLELRQAVQRLLKLSDNAGSFLEHPVLEGQAAVLEGIDPAVVYGNDDECGATIPGSNEIPLGYLEPATREDSLGRLMSNPDTDWNEAGRGRRQRPRAPSAGPSRRACRRRRCPFGSARRNPRR